jgi:hypothetical protein
VEQRQSRSAERERLTGRQESVPFRVYGRTPPGRTACSTAVPRILLTRKCSPGHLRIWLAASAAGSERNRHSAPCRAWCRQSSVQQAQPSERSLRRDQPEDSPVEPATRRRSARRGRNVGSASSARTCGGMRQRNGGWIDRFLAETHPEFRPAGATRCQSLLLAGPAILGADLHEWLFLLVTTCGRNAFSLSL